MTKTLVEQLRTETDPEWFRALMITAASRIEELERAQVDLADDLGRRALVCDQVKPNYKPGARYHFVDGKADAYRHAAFTAHQALSDKG
jgi:hypothetical protein